MAIEFYGTMLIKPIPESGVEPFEKTCYWTYNAEHKCWYGGGVSYPEEICEPPREIQ